MTSVDVVSFSRPLLLAFLVGTVVAGLVIRAMPGLWGDLAGGMLYTIALALGLAIIWSHGAPEPLAAAAVAISWVVESLQAAGVAGAAARAWPPARLMFGTTFVWWDLPAYAVGGMLAYAVLRATRRA